MRFNVIFSILGDLMKFVGIIFLIPIVVAFVLNEPKESVPFLITAIVVFVFSFLLSSLKAEKKDIDNIKKTESLALVFITWLMFALICTIPYLFYDFNFTNAFFEGASGVTTTGATIMKDFSLYPRTLFFFRSLTQWFGGMGIVVLFIAVLPKIAVAGRQMFYAEIPAPIEDKATPRIRFTASWLWGIYFIFTLIETLVLMHLGLSPYDASVTAISTISTGGFSPYSDSILVFANSKVTICVLFFMFISGLNFILIYRMLRKKSLTSLFKSEEFKVYSGIIIFISLFLGISLFLNSNYALKPAFLHSLFEVVASITSTGFACVDYINWDVTSKVILFTAFFIGGCASSTSGGIKIVRWIFMWKYLKRELNKIVHSQAVYPIKIEGAPLAQDVISQMVAFLVFYFVLFAIAAFIITLLENNTTIALSASASAIANIGPGFGLIGPMGNYADLHSVTKWIVILLMIVGRLEIIPFLAILNKELWKK